MAGPNDDRPDGAPSHIHIEKKKGINWLPWLLLALGLLALLLALSRCNRNETASIAPAAVAPVAVPEATPTGETAAPAREVVAATPTADSADALAGTSAVDAFLASTEPTPRTFVFEKLNFDTADSKLRPGEDAEIGQVATTLKQHANARIRIAGYADSRGTDAANMALGKARAESIKAALVAQGTDASHIETASGGENDPVDTNATASGRSENRRTELVVTAR